jgi:hypothetical protein
LRADAVRFVIELKERGKKKAQDIRPVSGPVVFSSLTLARGMSASAVFPRFKRSSHPRTRLNRRRRYATVVIEHHPKLRIQVAPLPSPGNLHQTAQAEVIGLFSALFAIEHRARVRRYGMYRAHISCCQEMAGAVLSPSRYERANASQPVPDVNNRARAGEEVVQCEPRQIGFTQVLSDPPDVCWDQASRNKATIHYTGSASALRSRHTEFGPFGRHG